MATTRRPATPRLAPLPARSRIESATNDEIVQVFEVVCDDIYRRLKNYGTIRDPRALLDGLKFAKRLARIHMDLAIGRGLDYRWGIHRVEKTLTDRLADAAFDEDAS